MLVAEISHVVYAIGKQALSFPACHSQHMKEKRNKIKRKLCEDSCKVWMVIWIQHIVDWYVPQSFCSGPFRTPCILNMLTVLFNTAQFSLPKLLTRVL